MPRWRVQAICPEATLNVSDVTKDAEPHPTDIVCLFNEYACEFSNLRGTEGRVLIDKNVSESALKTSL